MKYLVTAEGGPGFATPEEAVNVLENFILPTFDALMKMERKKLISGGLPVGERTIIFVLEASSNEEADKLLRGLPAWGLFDWEVIPLQSIKGRADTELDAVRRLKKLI